MKNNYEILNLLRLEKDIIRTELMSDFMLKNIENLENKRKKELIPLYNEGLKNALKEEEAILVVKDTEKTEHRTKKIKNVLTLRTQSGKIIGEEIYDKNVIKELKRRHDVYFLSKNFVTYTRLSHPNEKQFFIVSNGSIEYVTNQNIQDSVKSLVVALPSIESDHYIKDCFGLPYKDTLETYVIGFTR